MYLFLHNLTADITRRWTPFDKQEILKYRLFTYYTKQSKSHDLQRYTKHLLNDKNKHKTIYMYTNNWVYIETNEKQLNGFERYSYGSSKS